MKTSAWTPNREQGVSNIGGSSVNWKWSTIVSNKDVSAFGFKKHLFFQILQLLFFSASTSKVLLLFLLHKKHLFHQILLTFTFQNHFFLKHYQLLFNHFSPFH
ncbi:unnamed protein product [Cuscuta epithymum]|uniref:Uncharacterized protein n=1 Tax=Cuscuta epithymum TaxID=186058 RepID=A0AAV0EUL3_9ASTE|nr:unnamed protein product [Cuscuta epithymum]